MKRSLGYKFLRLFFGGVGPRLRVYLYLMILFRNAQHLKIAKFFSLRLQRKYGLFISHKSYFDMSLDLKHPVGVVIGDGVKIGVNVKIFQNVTIGGARIGDWKENNYPQIGDNTVIFAGAVVVGNIKIGKYCVIGANAVVTKDVPDYATVVGIPARIVKITQPI